MEQIFHEIDERSVG
jgi:Ca2+-binding EF-hand superfamily protein